MASKLHVPDPYLIDDENRPLTDEEIKGLRPAREIFAERGIPFPANRPQRDGEVQYIVNLDVRVVEFLKAEGGDWQTRLNEKLLELARQSASKKAS